MKFSNIPEHFIEKFPDINICLLSLEGSRGLGMETEDSDYDYKGIYIADTDIFLGLESPKEQYEYYDDELNYTIYEIGKFFKLALKGNPSILQTLFTKKYNIKTDIGDMIIKNRYNFLGAKYIRDAYGGYAMQQILYLKRNHKFSKARSTEDKIKKHIRHCFRLFDQGQELLTTGELTVRLKDPQQYFDLAELTQEEIRDEFEIRDRACHECKSVLPDTPDMYLMNTLLS